MFVRHQMKESENYRCDKDQPHVKGSRFATATHWDQIPRDEGNVVPVVFITLVLVDSRSPRLTQSPSCEGDSCEIEENGKKP